MRRFQQLISLFLVLGFWATAQAAPVDGSSSFSRHNGNAWVNGDILTQSIEPHVWLQANPDPKPGNLGTFEVSFYVRGDYLENANEEDVDFQLQNPYRADGGRTINTVRPVYGEYGVYYQFDPKLQINWQSQGGLWQEDSGGGKGVIGLPPPIHGYVNLWLSVIGGSITGTGFYLTTNEFPYGGPDYLDDWNANVRFSGIIESQNFQIVPEPGMAALLGLVVPVWRRRRFAN